MNIGKFILTPFLPEDNIWVKTQKHYIIWSCLAAIFTIGCLYAITFFIEDMSILLVAIAKNYMCGAVISCCYQLAAWNKVRKPKSRWRITLYD